MSKSRRAERPVSTRWGCNEPKHRDRECGMPRAVMNHGCDGSAVLFQISILLDKRKQQCLSKRGIARLSHLTPDHSLHDRGDAKGQSCHGHMDTSMQSEAKKGQVDRCHPNLEFASATDASHFSVRLVSSNGECHFDLRSDQTVPGQCNAPSRQQDVAADSDTTWLVSAQATRGQET